MTSLQFSAQILFLKRPKKEQNLLIEKYPNSLAWFKEMKAMEEQVQRIKSCEPENVEQLREQAAFLKLPDEEQIRLLMHRSLFTYTFQEDKISREKVKSLNQLIGIYEKCILYPFNM